MAIAVRFIAAGANKEFHHEPSPFGGQPTLLVMSPAQAHGQFKAATRTTAGTTVIVQPKAGGSVIVTDILVSGEKQAGSDVTIQFTDGVNTEIMIVSDQVDATPTIAANLQSYFRGWRDARVELVTGGAGDATVTIGYFHSPDSQTFSEWDAER